MNQKGYLSSILLIILLLLIGASFFFLKNILKEDPPDFSANWGLEKVPEPFSQSKILYSGNKEYSLLIEYEDGPDGVSCKKTTFNSKGHQIASSDNSDFLRNATCLRGMDLSLEGFKNFSGDNIVFNILGREISIFNIPTGKVESLTYKLAEGQKDYNFFAADTDLKYLLFSKDGYAFIDQVKDFENKEVFNIQPLLNVESNDIISSYYDSVNKGILYLREDSARKKPYQFTYFDLKTKKMRNLKYVDRNLEAGGRDCAANSLMSEKGKLIFNGSCMDALPKDKNENGEIVFNL